MRYATWIAILFFAVPSTAFSLDRWVSPSGDDANFGTSGSPFKTINRCAQLAQAGDTCWIRAGTYRETVRPANSGTANSPISFRAFARERVIVSGAETVNGWTLHSGNIYKAAAALPITGHADTGFLANQVFVNGEMMTEARWPNMSTEPGRELDFMRPVYAGGSVDSPNGLAAVVNNNDIPLISEPWAGATVWTSEWYTSRTGTITDVVAGSNGKSLNATMTAAWGRGGFWFYLSNKLSLLDAPREWFYDGSQLYLWAPSGLSPQNVEAKQRNFAFDLTDRSHIRVIDISLFASTITTSNASENVVLDNIDAKFVSHHATLPEPPLAEWSGFAASRGDFWLTSHAHDTGIQLRGRNHTLRNSRLSWSSGNGVLLKGRGHTVANNRIENTNYMVSLAAAIRINGDSHRIHHNTIARTGRDAMIVDWHTTSYDFPNTEIAYNDISRFGMLSTDLGAIYVCCYINMAGTTIHHNHIREGYGFSSFWGTRGIYFDIESFNSTVHHNVTWNMAFASDNASFLASTERGYHRVFNNTFATNMFVDRGLEARNNILRGDASLTSTIVSNNLLSDVDPRFTDIANNNFTLSANSPAVDAGTAIAGITTDVKGAAPDIGAYERGGIEWKTGAVEVVVPPTVCPFDVDRSGASTAATDGLMISQHALGFQATSLTHPLSARASASQVVDDVITRELKRLDVNDDGVFDFNDALMIVRYLAGITNDSIAANVKLSGARNTPQKLLAYLTNGCPVAQ